jgi:hypothetical protein
MKTKITEFYDSYINIIRSDHIDLFSTLQGVHFLPVDKNVYLKVQSFTNGTENSFPEIQATAIFYKEYLIWSGFEQDIMRTLYTFFGSKQFFSNIEDLGTKKPGK